MKTSIRSLSVCIVFAISTNVSVAYASTDCARLEAARERAWQQLRRNHSASQANRLHARVRELNEQIASHCH